MKEYKASGGGDTKEKKSSDGKENKSKSKSKAAAAVSTTKHGSGSNYVSKEFIEDDSSSSDDNDTSKKVRTLKLPFSLQSLLVKNVWIFIGEIMVRKSVYYPEGIHDEWKNCKFSFQLFLEVYLVVYMRNFIVELNIFWRIFHSLTSYWAKLGHICRNLLPLHYFTPWKTMTVVTTVENYFWFH